MPSSYMHKNNAILLHAADFILAVNRYLFRDGAVFRIFLHMQMSLAMPASGSAALHLLSAAFEATPTNGWETYTLSNHV
jgi:hypothetical protein